MGGLLVDLRESEVDQSGAAAAAFDVEDEDDADVEGLPAGATAGPAGAAPHEILAADVAPWVSAARAARNAFSSSGAAGTSSADAAPAAPTVHVVAWTAAPAASSKA
jgi:hypothetical protein